MRALTFLFALMVGLAMAFLAPAMAGGHNQAPAAMVAPEMAAMADEPAADQLVSDLLTDLSIDPAPVLDVAA
ncbi:MULTISPECIES: hypothetical protein [Cyanophyceae]|jgi:hypothetical protein|uniref:Uncharacterized protein n=1 Tax=Aphanothece cf. minutissima CCALA 015 TaxID=2107695 RepID=A0ABX5F462_9CHRO|nr:MULTISPECIES: hypothetical protein [Cyanophyceae]MCP9796308.1 hypothetical protein [Cyanobium sp. Lug-B]MCP9934594.1 hypothetical protein [Cyanobium sp. Candia 9D4]PSB36105.1 hypothetical protein C7B81_15140 [Aphanothece cf. minutissima CCALA 015]